MIRRTSHMLVCLASSFPTTSSCSPEVMSIDKKKTKKKGRSRQLWSTFSGEQEFRNVMDFYSRNISRSYSGPKRREVALATHVPRFVWYRLLNKLASPCMRNKMYGVFWSPFPTPGWYWYWVLSYPSSLAIGFKTGTFD